MARGLKHEEAGQFDSGEIKLFLLGKRSPWPLQSCRLTRTRNHLVTIGLAVQPLTGRVQSFYRASCSYQLSVSFLGVLIYYQSRQNKSFKPEIRGYKVSLAVRSLVAKDWPPRQCQENFTYRLPATKYTAHFLQQVQSHKQLSKRARNQRVNLGPF